MLFRAAHHSGALEVELVRRNIPFVKFGGLKFLDAAHVKDLLACLRFAENPRDRIAGFRVAAAACPASAPPPPRRCSTPMAAAPSRRRAAPRPGRRRAPPDWAGFAALFARLRAGAPAGRPSSTRSAPGTSRTSSACTTTPRVRRADLVQLEAIAAGFPGRERFLTEITLDPPGATGDRRRRRRTATRTT